MASEMTEDNDKAPALPWFKVANCIARCGKKLTDHEKALVMVLLSYQRKDGTIYLYHAQLATDLGVTDLSHLRRTIRSLKDKRAITVIYNRDGERNKANNYILNYAFFTGGKGAANGPERPIPTGQSGLHPSGPEKPIPPGQSGLHPSGPEKPTKKNELEEKQREDDWASPRRPASQPEETATQSAASQPPVRSAARETEEKKEASYVEQKVEATLSSEAPTLVGEKKHLLSPGGFIIINREKKMILEATVEGVTLDGLEDYSHQEVRNLLSQEGVEYVGP